MKYFICILALVAHVAIAQINKNGQLNNYKYNEIVFLTTHNAYNSQNDGFLFPNQNHHILRQLTDGVRALMIDVYEQEGELIVCHATKALGYKFLHDELKLISNFLENNPNEVITIIFECYSTANNIEKAIVNAGLKKYLYTNTNTKLWPTIGEMIETNKRLVVFSDKNDAATNQSWYHYLWKYAVETTFEAKDTTDFSSQFQRGKPINSLFIVNHFLSTFIGTGTPLKAKAINSNPYLERRLTKLISETGKNINFLTVDFYDIGDCIYIVNKMNKISSENDVYSHHFKIQLFPNPVNASSQIVIPYSARPPYYYTISSLEGKLLFKSNYYWENTFDIRTENLLNGAYILNLIDIEYNKSALKFIKQFID